MRRRIALEYSTALDRNCIVAGNLDGPHVHDCAKRPELREFAKCRNGPEATARALNYVSRKPRFTAVTTLAGNARLDQQHVRARVAKHFERIETVPVPASEVSLAEYGCDFGS